MTAQAHASALAAIRSKGAAVVFTSITEGEHDPLTETFGEPTVTTIEGYALGTRAGPADVELYTANGLSVSDTLTLLFAPETYGELPPIGSEVIWAGDKLFVRTIAPLAPAGTAIIARIGVTR